MGRLDSPFLLHETMDLIASREQHDLLRSCLRSALRVGERARLVTLELKERPSRAGRAWMVRRDLKEAVESLKEEQNRLLHSLTDVQQEIAHPQLRRLARISDQIDCSIRALDHSLTLHIPRRRAARHHLRRIGRDIWHWKKECSRLARRLYA